MQQPVRTDDEREAILVRWMTDYKTSLMRMACLYLGDRALAEDAVQETFLRAWRRMDTFRGDSGEKTWLIRIAVNVCNDVRRTAWMRLVRQPLSACPEPAREDQYRDDTVVRAVTALPPRDRQMILLRFYQELKVKEIAQVLNIGEACAASRLHRAEKKLAAALKGWYFDED